MLRANDLREFVQTLNLPPEEVTTIEERLNSVTVTIGGIPGLFSDCDTIFVLGSEERDNAFQNWDEKVRS